MDLCIPTKMARWLSYYSLLIPFRNVKVAAGSAGEEWAVVVEVVVGSAVAVVEAAVVVEVVAGARAVVEAVVAGAGEAVAAVALAAEEQLLLEAAEEEEGEDPLAGMVVLGEAEGREDPGLLERRVALEIIP